MRIESKFLTTEAFGSLARFAIAMLAAALLTVSLVRADVPGEYKGRRLYRHAVDQAVRGYKMACRSQQEKKLWFNRLREGYVCKGIDSDASFEIQAIANTKKNVLRAIHLLPINEIAYSASEDLIGGDILYRVIATTEETYGMKCRQLHDSLHVCNPGTFADESTCRYRMRFSCVSNEGALGSERQTIAIKAIIDAQTSVFGERRERVSSILFRP